MNSHNGSVTIYIREVELEVEYKYYFEAGVHTLSNGDPGYPDESELEITDIYKDGKDYTPILERYDSMYPKEDIFGEIEESVSENMDDSYDDYEPDFDYDDFADRY